MRIVVGRMGAGKTRCLVELRNDLDSVGDYELTPMEFDLPSLGHVIRLAEDLAMEDPVDREEIWRKVWQRAIMRSALSRTDSGTPNSALPTDLLPLVERVRAVGPPLLPESSVPHSIYTAFGAILRDNPTLAQLRRFVDDPRWEEVEYCFEQLVERRTRPLCFFLDTGEEDSSHAPRYWLYCQLGLVRQVLRFSQNERLAQNLRLFVAIRDQTWAELASGNPAMFGQHPKVQELRWGPRSAAHFLAEKIKQLPEGYLLGGPRDTDDPQTLVSAWLGVETMSNGSSHGDPQRIAVYLLRHTRLIPRDIVTVGNLLSDEVLAAKERDDHSVPLDCIHNAVAESARLSAREELQACALEVIAHQLSRAQTAADRRRIVPDEDAASRTLEAIKELLGKCREDVVSRDTLASVDSLARERFDAPVSLPDMLWRRGLIGWSSDEAGPFSFRSSSRPSPPARRHRGYVAIHPCLVDEVGLDAGPSPVIPFPESELP